MKIMKKFLQEHRSEIIQKTNNVISLADELHGAGLIKKQSYSEIFAETTEESKMRKTYTFLNSEKISTYVYNWLKKNEGDMMEELENNPETEAPDRTKFRTESDKTDCTNKPPDLKVLNTMAKLDEYVSNSEINEVLINNLRAKLDTKDMESLESVLESKRPKMSLCLNASDVNNIRRNKELKSFHSKTKNAIFPKIAYNLFFERDPDFTSANNNSNIEENSESMNHEEDDDMCVAELYNSEFTSQSSSQSPQIMSSLTIQSHPQSDLNHHSNRAQTEEQLTESHCKSNKNELLISQQTKLSNAQQTELEPSEPKDINDAMHVEKPEDKQMCKTKHTDVYEPQQLENNTALIINKNIQVNKHETNQHCEQREKSTGYFIKPKAEEKETQSEFTDVQQDPDVYPLRIKGEDGSGLKKYMKWSTTDKKFSTEIEKTDRPPQTHGSGPSDDLNGPLQQRTLIQKDFSQKKKQIEECFIADFLKTENPVQETDDAMDFQENLSEASKHSDFETFLYKNPTNGVLENIHQKSEEFGTLVKTPEAPTHNNRNQNETFIQQHAGNREATATVEAVDCCGPSGSEVQSNSSSIFKNHEMESNVSQENVNMNIQASRGVSNQHFHSELGKENTLVQKKTHVAKFKKKEKKSDMFSDGPKTADVFSGDPCQNVPLRMKTDGGILLKKHKEERKTDEVTVCDQLQNEPAVEMTGADEVLSDGNMDIQNSLHEANRDTDKETFYTEAGSGVKETEMLPPTPGSKSPDSPSNELQPKLTCSQLVDQGKEHRLEEQRMFMEEGVKEQLRSTCDPEKEQPEKQSGGDSTALDRSESQRKQKASKRKLPMTRLPVKKLKKREDQWEKLRVWAKSQCRDRSEEELRRVFGSISTKDVVKHKEYPFFRTRDVMVYKDPNTGVSQIISFEEKLTAETTTQLHYRMFVCDINQTVLLGSSKQEISLNKDLVHVNSCLKVISECFIPAFAVYKNIQRRKHLHSLLRADTHPNMSSC